MESPLLFPGLKIPQAQAATNTNIQRFFLLLVAGPSNFGLYMYDSLTYFFFSPLSPSSVTLTFTAQCHSFSFVSLMPWSRYYWSVCQATVSDVQSPKVQGKVWCSDGSRERLPQPSESLLHPPPCSTSPDGQGMLPSWDLTLRHYTHQVIKKLRGQQLIYHVLWLGTPCGTVKAGGKGEGKKKSCAKAIVDSTFFF